MVVKRTILPILVGALLAGSATMAFGQAAKMTQAFGDYKAAAQKLVALHKGAQDAAAAKAAEAKMAAANKQKEAAVKAIEAALKKLNPKSEKDGKLAEKIFAEMQAVNEAVVEAALKAAEAQAAAKMKIK